MLGSPIHPVLPLAFPYLSLSDLVTCCLVNSTWFELASSLLYSHLDSSKINLGKLLQCLLCSKTRNYSKLIKSVDIKHVYYHETELYPCWRNVKELLGLASATLVSLRLGVDDGKTEF